MTDFRHWTTSVALALVSLTTVLVGAQATRPGQRPNRDTPAQPGADAATPAGRITGRVVAADTGRPVIRARVFLSGAQIQGGRGALTDTEGRFELTDLPEGRYTLTAGKTGFITLSFGQRRPLQAGTTMTTARECSATRCCAKR